MAQEPPRISIIIAAHNVENFIEKAVVSALEQGVAFHQVIAVNDAATDRTGQILDALAAEYAELKVIHNATNVGLGPVRNIGMKAATGDYICFLDGDDYLLPGAVHAMNAALRTRPEVVIYNYARLYPNGVAKPNALTDSLSPATHHSPDARKALFRNLNVAWNKLYSRKFLKHTGLKFPEGKYEDICWNYSCLMMARDIVTTPELMVHYRQRDGSILRARNTTHFDVFDRWAEVFATLDAHPDLKKTYGDTLKVLQFKGLCTVLDDPYRLPQSTKPAFAARIHAVCGSARDLPRGQLAQIERVLDVPGGNYVRPYLNTPPILWLREAAKVARTVVRGLPKQLLYRHVFLRLPIDPNLVIYQSYWGKKIACNPYALFAHLQKTKGNTLKHVWVCNSDVDLRGTKGHALHLRENSLKYFYYMARAGMLINNANFPDAIIKRPGSVHVQTKHGTPLKYMGLDLAEKDPTAFASTWDFAKRCARWDYVISSNTYSTRVWRQGFPYNYRILETGYPRNDRLVTADASERATVRTKLGLPQDAEVVLYAPTFRPDYPASAPTQQSKEDILTAILAGLKDGQILAIRDHYFLDPDSHYRDDPRLVDLSAHPSTTDVLLATDLLITDYSSIMFDYAVRDKPIVLLGHDLDLYRAARGIYFDISVQHPGIFCTDLSGLTHTLAEQTYDQPQARQMRADFRTLFCHLDDGHATQKVCDVLFDTEKKG